jgi:hypothetical protein
MGAGGQAGAGGWDGPGSKWRALINNSNGYKMVGESAGGPSVRISDSNVDNIVTLYHLRRASGCPADCT